ncbi:hypothetical protein ACIBCO_30960 [Streptomyces violascens]|uniref:hypothetical protein n=1 Tax=Streptomyces violascens TaxID=67381 RepID=UPI0037B0355A
MGAVLLVVTRELLSLSLSLGAFAALFLVSGQRPEERTVYLHKDLFRLRRALVVYSVYRSAQEHAAEWTGVRASLRTPENLRS